MTTPRDLGRTARPVLASAFAIVALLASSMGQGGALTQLSGQGPMTVHTAGTSGSRVQLAPGPTGELDCNGQSPVQTWVRPTMACTDIRGFAGIDNANNWDARFFDNGLYIGHDEPDMTFLSTAPSSGDNVTWNETLGADPAAAPNSATPGYDTSHWFELSIAPWFSMAMCDGNSYPQMACSPQNDSNAPQCIGICAPNQFPGGGSAFMEMQFYPPGFAPFADAVSCDNSHWCAALTIDSLECTNGFAQCNSNCVEPVNFAFIQTNGVPTGPPSPQQATTASFTPNAQTLLMNPGDNVSVRMADEPVPGGGGARAFEVTINDLTTGLSGFMQASAANGFADTSIANCNGIPFNFEPEYSSAAPGHIVPWAALQTDISTEFEIGHFTPCTSVSGQIGVGAGGSNDKEYGTCTGAYEATPDSGTPETSDGLCYPQGDTHGTLNSAPDQIAGCLNDYYQNGDLDFDGSGYWTEWPVANNSTAKLPSSFLQDLPLSQGQSYPQFYFQSDVALSESTCSGVNSTGCAIPAPGSPGGFYPYWSLVTNATGACHIEFGNVGSGTGVRDFSQDAQFGSDQIATLGYPEFESRVHNASCAQPHAVSFDEQGLPSGTPWQVWLNSTTGGADYHALGTTANLTVGAVNDSYVYAIGDVAGWHLSSGAYSGPVAVTGASQTLTFTFARTLYPVAFTETGLSLAGGAAWSVVLGTATQTSSTAAMNFSEPNGTFVFGVSSPGWTASPSSGSVTVAGAPPSATRVQFAQVLYPLSISEIGLPTGTTWWANLTGGVSLTSAGSVQTVQLANGTYALTLASSDRAYAAPGTSITILAAPLSVTVVFSPVTYAVTFKQSGLPTGTSWEIVVTNGFSLTSSGSTISFSEANGSYTFQPLSSNSAYAAVGGSLSVNGAPVSENVSFSRSTYSVAFIETGLPQGTSWSVALNGGSQSSSGSSVVFGEPGGSYSYTVGPVAGYVVSPSSGSVQVANGSVTVGVTFVASGGSTGSTQPSGVSMNVAYALVGVIVLLALVVVALLVMSRRRGGSGGATTGPSASSAAEPASSAEAPEPSEATASSPEEPTPEPSEGSRSEPATSATSEPASEEEGSPETEAPTEPESSP